MWLSYEIIALDVLRSENFEGSDRDARKTARNLLEKIHSCDFYVCILFMKIIVYKMKTEILEDREIDKTSLQVWMQYARQGMKCCEYVLMKLNWMV